MRCFAYTEDTEYAPNAISVQLLIYDPSNRRPGGNGPVSKDHIALYRGAPHGSTGFSRQKLVRVRSISNHPSIGSELTPISISNINVRHIALPKPG